MTGMNDFAAPHFLIQTQENTHSAPDSNSRLSSESEDCDIRRWSNFWAKRAAAMPSSCEIYCVRLYTLW